MVNTSDLAQRAPAEFRGEAVAFERDAAIAKTAQAMSSTPPAALKASTAAELAERLTISRERDAFRLELRGQGEEGAAGAVNRAEIQRILQMLYTAVMQAGWLVTPATDQPASPAIPGEAKSARH